MADLLALELPVCPDPATPYAHGHVLELDWRAFAGETAEHAAAFRCKVTGRDVTTRFEGPAGEYAVVYLDRPVDTCAWFG